MKSKIFGAVILSLFCFAATAKAAPIVGNFNIAGSVTVTGIDGPDADLLNNQYKMDFFPAGTGAGVVDTTFPASGYFLPLFPPASTVNNLDVSDIVTAGFTQVTTGAAVSVPNFLNGFSAMPGLTFELTRMVASSAPVCTGGEGLNQPCSASANSPFTLTNTDTGVAVGFGVLGIFRNGIDIGAGVGAYTTQVVGGSIVSILTNLAAGQGVPNSFSANYVSAQIPTVPEPATLLTLGLGSGLLALRRRRQQRKAEAAQ